MLKSATIWFLVSFSGFVLTPLDALAREEPPTLSGVYQSIEATWSNQNGSNMGRVIIAIDPSNIAADGKIWFPMEGTCTWGNWGTIEPASFQIDDKNRLLPIRETIQMNINGNCGEATAKFEPDKSRLRITRKNSPGYTFYINFLP